MNRLSAAVAMLTIALGGGAGPLEAVADESPAAVAVYGDTVHTMAGPPIENGVVIIVDGRIREVATARAATIPANATVLRGKVVTPGLVDAHTAVGLTGYLNHEQDQDHLDHGEPIQPELRAIDSYNPRERLIEWLRGFGITTIHTGHAPGALISGQTMVAKTVGDTVEEAVIRPAAMIAVTLGDDARPAGGDSKSKSPGTRSKAVAMLRGEFVKTLDYLRKQRADDAEKKPDRDLRREAFAEVLAGRLPLLVTVNRATDIDAALRIAAEFKIPIVLDSAAEAYLLTDRIKQAKVPVIVHPSMRRAGMGATENIGFETAATLRKAGIPVALQSGYEAYVPKTRVVLFEAGIAAANGLAFEEALASVTIDAARIIGVDDRVGSLQPGRDGDVAIFDGDPFEYTTHCTAVVVNGRVVSQSPR